MTSLIRSSVPRSRPLTTDSTIGRRREVRRDTRATVARRCADGAAKTTRSVGVGEARRIGRRRRPSAAGRRRAGAARCGRSSRMRAAVSSAVAEQRDRLDAGRRAGRAWSPTPRRRRPRRAGRRHRPARRRRRSRRAPAARRPPASRLPSARRRRGLLAARQLDRRPVAEDEPDRRAVEAERLAQPVLEVAPVQKWTAEASEAKNTNVGGAIAAWVA